MALLLGVGALFLLLLVTHIPVATPKIEERKDTNTFQDVVSNVTKKQCGSIECVTADEILGKMDRSVNPCENFFKFACGNFINTAIIPEDKSEVSIFSLINDKLDLQLKTILEEPVQKDELEIFQKTKMLYANCMDRARIEEYGIGIVKEALTKFGGWPVLLGSNWNESAFNWRDLIYKFRSYGYTTSHYILIDISVDAGENTKRIIYLEPPIFALNRDFLVLNREDKILKGYYEYMVDIAVLFGAEKEFARMEMNDVLDFEIALANRTLPSEQRRNISLLYNKFTLREVQDNFPTIPWLEYINSHLPPQVQINEEEIVVVTEPAYLMALEELLGTTPNRTQANYLIWKIVTMSVDLLSENARNISLKFKRISQGAKELPVRWKKCVHDVRSMMSNVLGSLYVRKYFDQESKAEITNIMKYIRAEFAKILKENSWMDERTKHRALEKLQAMTQHIAYPDELLNDTLLTKVYGEIKVEEGEFYHSMLNIGQFQRNFLYKRLKEKVNKTEWISHGAAAIVNAYYNHLENSIKFPAGILQGHFFNREHPKYMNFGAFGSVVGHEITHGFDDIGRQFDKLGNLNEWWEKETKSAFLEKANCIIKQYSNYTVPEVNMTINGKNTVGENIADNGGITESYFAYQTWLTENNPEPELPGLPYGPNQMYWISVAQTWCHKVTPETLRYKLLVDAHSPQEFRVIVPFSNSKEFSKDYNCPEGSYMNPKIKCKVW